MKIVFVTSYYTEGMGYLFNCLPKKLAELGHEVYVISSQGQIYFNQAVFENYNKIHKRNTVSENFKIIDGVKVYRVPHFEIMRTVYLRGLWRILHQIKPDVVHVFEIASPYILQLAIAKPFLRYKLFTSNHYVLSVFALHKNWNKFSLAKMKWLLLKKYPGYFISFFTNKCFPATNDARYVAVKYMGMPLRKCKLTPLGVDTELFKPINSAEDLEARDNLRKQLGFQPDDIVCIYTGRFSRGKNPLILAKAIELLHDRGFNEYKGIFIGVGEQEQEIGECKGSKIIGFEEFKNLYKFYQASDIGVWPTQESTSMIDAAACGIPIIVSDQLYARERTQGNGLDYKHEDYTDLSIKLLILRDPALRARMGAVGSEKMKNKYSWDIIAKEREADYLLY
jgi:glycosyltransferase involved in cell wall biosynthesis